MSVLTLKISENNNRIDDLLEVDKNIKKDIISNTTKIGTNESDIGEIKSNLSNIDFNSNNIYSIENFFIYNIEIENSYKLNKDKTSFSILKYTLEDNFKKDSILQFDCRLLYQYHNYNHIGLLQHIFKLYDNTDTMFYDYQSLKFNAGDNRRYNVKQNYLLYVKLDDYGVIKIELILSLIDDVDSTVDCKIYNACNSNFLCNKYNKKINVMSVYNDLGDLESTILSNKNDISTNLININTNEDNIVYNLSEITYIKNNISKSYLKNVYNILYYNVKEKIDFNNNFYDKRFELNV